MKYRISRMILACSMAWTCSPADRPGVDHSTVDRPPSMPSPESIAEGRRSYLNHCAVCHGESGRGDGPRSRNLASRPRDLARPGWLESQTRESLLKTVRDGVPGTDMPSWEALDDEELLDLVLYLRTLDQGASR